MGTLSSELAPHVDRSALEPRFYADANIPAGLVTFMREQLRWDVFFVLEQDSLRRAPDLEHFRLARQLHRTLVTLDRDYLDDRRFPPQEGAGILVISAPDERGLANLLRRLHHAWFAARTNENRAAPLHVSALPLQGRKLHAHADWTIDASGNQDGP